MSADEVTDGDRAEDERASAAADPDDDRHGSRGRRRNAFARTVYEVGPVDLFQLGECPTPGPEDTVPALMRLDDASRAQDRENTERIVRELGGRHGGRR